MMDKEQELPESGMVSCDICCLEVPISSAKTPESVDYVVYFCGLDCYAKWRQQGEQGEEIPE